MPIKAFLKSQDAFKNAFELAGCIYLQGEFKYKKESGEYFYLPCLHSEWIVVLEKFLVLVLE